MSFPAKEKVAIFVCNDLTGWLIVNGLVPRMKAIGYEPVIFNTGDHRNRQFKIPSPPVVAFFNAALPRDTLAPALESQPIAHAPNHTLRQLAVIHGIAYREIENVNDPAFIAEIAADETMRGGVAARFLQVFEEEAIALFHAKGFLWNLHSGLLPERQGLLTPYPAIAEGDKIYGVTLHDLIYGIDRGDIISRGELPLDASKPVLDLYMDTVPVGVDMVVEALRKFKQDGFVERIPQVQLGAPRYHTNPTAEEFARYTASNIFYADLQSTVERIANLFTVKGTVPQINLQHTLEQAVCKAADISPQPLIIPVRQEGFRPYVA